MSTQPKASELLEQSAGPFDAACMLVREMESEQERLRYLIGHIFTPQMEEMENLLVWVLYHHQGGSSEIGQPIRAALGMGRHQHLTQEQIDKARETATSLMQTMVTIR